ncbi:MAG: hypothetical protein ACI4U3_01875 [Traorella sp.]
MIDDNDEALMWRIKAIHLAQEEIIIATFEMRDDQSGTEIMNALLEAA